MIILYLISPFWCKTEARDVPQCIKHPFKAKPLFSHHFHSHLEVTFFLFRRDLPPFTEKDKGADNSFVYLELTYR